MNQEDKDTRYFIDLDLENKRIVGWGFGQRQKLTKEKIVNTRVYITKGQYNKLRGDNESN
jgi:hypothetical protein